MTGAIGFLLLLAIVRAATSRYAEQRDAIFSRYRSDQQRLALDRETTPCGNSTPEITPPDEPVEAIMIPPGDYDGWMPEAR